MLRSEVVWRSLGRAHSLRALGVRLVLLTTSLPQAGSEGDAALRAAGPHAFFDAVELFGDDGRRRLRSSASGAIESPQLGFWTVGDLAR